MSEGGVGALFAGAEGERSTGLLPAQLLRAAVHGGHEVMAAAPIGEDQIQPASLDLRLGEVAYRVRASFLPGARASVADKLALLREEYRKNPTPSNTQYGWVWVGDGREPTVPVGGQ